MKKMLIVMLMALSVGASAQKLGEHVVFFVEPINRSYGNGGKALAPAIVTGFPKASAQGDSISIWVWFDAAGFGPQSSNFIRHATSLVNGLSGESWAYYSEVRAWGVDFSDDTQVLNGSTPADNTDYTKWYVDPNQGNHALALVATTNSYSDLSGKPSLFSGAYSDLSGKPTLFSGAYSDLTGKPSLATVATSGSYNDLTNKPTGKRLEVYSGTTDSSGLYTVTFGTSFSVAPNIQANVIGGTTEQMSRIISVSTTGFQIHVYQRATVLGLALSTATTNVNGAAVDVVVNEK